MIHTGIELLDPRMQPGVKKLLRLSREAGLHLVVIETRRELATQLAYYSRGRCPVSVVQAYFKACKLWPISNGEASTASTQTLQSKHIDGLAVDIAPAKPNGAPEWNASPGVWETMYTIAEEECGLDACYAGEWNAWKWDRPHLEFHHEIGGENG